MIRRYILKTKVTKKALIKDKDQKNESTMNSKSKYENDKDCASAEMCPSESTE